MRTDTGKAVHLSDYRVPDFLVDRVDLAFALDVTDTIAECTLYVRPNPEGRKGAALVFDGDDLTVVQVALNGKALTSDDAAISPDGLTIPAPPQEPFVLKTTTRINPTANTQLSGLYRSGAAFCTQCEAEGFRRITYFPDRPDVLSVYTTRMEADRKLAPVLLGNGNLVDAGVLDNGRYFAVWHDPHPKPSYLFAIVGGDLASIKQDFVTASGKPVKLGIYVEKGKEDRAHYAMDALVRSMRWDEDMFGREYDLDIFNIVAVSDFNMGAMENKGLNIFNDKYILASPQTATDTDYAGIESVVAHEYFHNWTGNRITCRDWFQLCLKEGLTVFRDQEFSADQRSRAVRRIGDVRALRTSQFSEDAGPLAHNVRPDSYHEINNFYTATVYQKGAEVIRMLKTLIGDEAFRRGMDLYFQKYDGTAAIVEDFISCFEESSGRSLDQFMRWYNQAGTPHIIAKGKYDSASKTFSLTLTQNTPPTPGQERKEPQVIPVALGLIGRDRREVVLQCDPTAGPDQPNEHELAIATLEFRSASRTVVFNNVDSAPVPSLLRGFSAPVRLDYDYSEDELLLLIASDSDQLNRWQAAQTFATGLMRQSVASIRNGKSPVDASVFCSALLPVLNGYSDDTEFSALMLTLPSENDMAREIGTDVDPEAIYLARTSLQKALGACHLERLLGIYDTLAAATSKAFDPADSGVRALRGAALNLIAAADPQAGEQLASEQFARANTMTDKISALATLGLIGGQAGDAAFAEFYETHAGDALVIDKWFALQAMIPGDGALERVERLMKHPDFSLSNPNRLRSVIATFGFANPSAFNAANGEGYQLVARIVGEVDPRNPQIAARLLTAFKSWRSLEPRRMALAKEALQSIANKEPLSVDVRDIVTRTLN
jgi:aminopeptidase N